jgi:hypothetical protein
MRLECVRQALRLLCGFSKVKVRENYNRDNTSSISVVVYVFFLTMGSMDSMGVGCWFISLEKEIPWGGTNI